MGQSPRSADVPRTALIVVVPEAGGVESWRLEHDWSAARGVPAHVTVLFPFVAAADAGPALLEELRSLFQSLPSFDAAFERVERFEPGIVWLAPEPEAPFVELTERVARRWPEHPPYEGAHEDVIPHLTIADDASPADVEALCEAVRRELPIRARVEAVELWREDEAGQWSPLARFPLA